MARLSPTLKNITHEFVLGCGVRSAVIALVSAAPSDGATNYTRCAVERSVLVSVDGFHAFDSCAQAASAGVCELIVLGNSDM